ncbi:SWIM zinc finger family protein [Escherichia coli]|nr:SWIM zinc finger family protein [Escherichia coli]EKK2711047.1 SWIM zinc finger family protein [Escherichia coli O121]EEU2854523.1 SWIM zinc finger family protein [Escherichia coli]EEZ3886954.1 SWIM zinc finger family protein [Escherichia coli]EEZ4026681.1 SWIM zinc finger family protein [Escherichia coli]
MINNDARMGVNRYLKIRRYNVRYQLLANSSRGDGFYDVTISDNSGNLEIECTCMAGEMGTMCKHRIAVITGKYGNIIDIDDPENADAKLATDLIAKYGITEQYLALAKELEDLKKRFKVEEKAIKLRINALAG